MRRKPGYEAWSLQRGHLVGYGHTRKEFAVSFSPQAPITVDVEAKGKQNLLVSFRGNRTLVGGLGYMLEQLPIAKMGRGGGGDGLRKFLDRLDRTIDQSRKRGPSLALFVEESLLTHKELLALPVKLKSKSKFSVELNAEEKELRVRVKKVDEAASFERKIGGKDVRVSLLTMGAVVGYDRVTITGQLSESFLNRLRSAARDAGGDLDKLPEQFRKNERDRLKRESERARDRGRDRDDDEDD
jgi:hypothetical protein